MCERLRLITLYKCLRTMSGERIKTFGMTALMKRKVVMSFTKHESMQPNRMTDGIRQAILEMHREFEAKKERKLKKLEAEYEETPIDPIFFEKRHTLCLRCMKEGEYAPTDICTKQRGGEQTFEPIYLCGSCRRRYIALEDVIDLCWREIEQVDEEFMIEKARRQLAIMNCRVEEWRGG